MQRTVFELKTTFTGAAAAAVAVAVTVSGAGAGAGAGYGMRPGQSSGAIKEVAAAASS